MGIFRKDEKLNENVKIVIDGTKSGKIDYEQWKIIVESIQELQHKIDIICEISFFHIEKNRSITRK